MSVVVFLYFFYTAFGYDLVCGRCATTYSVLSGKEKKRYDDNFEQVIHFGGRLFHYGTIQMPIFYIVPFWNLIQNKGLVLMIFFHQLVENWNLLLRVSK